MRNAGLPFGYAWKSDLARSHNHMGHAVYVTCHTALHLAIHLARTTCDVALGALRRYLWAAPQQQCPWTSLLWSATALEETSEKIPTPPLGCYLRIGTARAVLSLVCVRAHVCTDLLNVICEQAVPRGSRGWRLAVVPQARMQLHTAPEAENLFPIVSRTVGTVASKKQWRSYSFLQLLLLLVILSNNKDVKI